MLHTSYFEHVHSEYTNIYNSNLQDGVGEKEPISDVVQKSGARAAHGIKLQDLLRRLRLACTTFTRDEDKMVVGFTDHCPVNIVSKCKAEK